MFDVSLEIIDQITRVRGQCLIQGKKDIKTQKSLYLSFSKDRRK